MTKDQFKAYLVDIAKKGDYDTFDLVARCLDEADTAKKLLRAKGYGVSGMGILETASEVPAAEGLDG